MVSGVCFPKNSHIYTFTYYIYIDIHSIHYHTLLDYTSHRNFYLPQTKIDGRSAGMVLQCLEVSDVSDVSDGTGHIAR